MLICDKCNQPCERGGKYITEGGLVYCLCPFCYDCHASMNQINVMAIFIKDGSSQFKELNLNNWNRNRLKARERRSRGELIWSGDGISENK